LKGKDSEKFIECDRSKGHRLSTHPDFITCDKKKLMDHPEDDIRRLMEGVI